MTRDCACWFAKLTICLTYSKFGNRWFIGIPLDQNPPWQVWFLDPSSHVGYRALAGSHSVCGLLFRKPSNFFVNPTPPPDSPVVTPVACLSITLTAGSVSGDLPLAPESRSLFASLLFSSTPPVPLHPDPLLPDHRWTTPTPNLSPR